MKSQKLPQEEAWGQAIEIKNKATEKAREKIKSDLGADDSEIDKNFTPDEINKETTAGDYALADQELDLKKTELKEKYGEVFAPELWQVIKMKDEIAVAEEKLDNYKDENNKLLLSKDGAELLVKEIKKMKKDLIELNRQLKLLEFKHIDKEYVNELRATGINVGEIEYEYKGAYGESSDGYMRSGKYTDNVHKYVILESELKKADKKNQNFFREYDPEHPESWAYNINWEQQYPHQEISEFKRAFYDIPENAVAQAELRKNELGDRVFINAGKESTEYEVSIKNKEYGEGKYQSVDSVKKFIKNNFIFLPKKNIEINDISALPEQFYLKNAGDNIFAIADEKEYTEYQSALMEDVRVISEEPMRDWEEELAEKGNTIKGFITSVEQKSGSFQYELKLSAPGIKEIEKKVLRDNESIELMEDEIESEIEVSTTNVVGIDSDTEINGEFYFKPYKVTSGKYRGNVYFKFQGK